MEPDPCKTHQRIRTDRGPVLAWTMEASSSSHNFESDECYHTTWNSPKERTMST